MYTCSYTCKNVYTNTKYGGTHTAIELIDLVKLGIQTTVAGQWLSHPARQYNCDWTVHHPWMFGYKLKRRNQAFA